MSADFVAAAFAALRIKPAALAAVGDLVFVNATPHIVLEINTYASGTVPEHAARMTFPGYVVREVLSTGGPRYVEHPPGGRYRGAEVLHWRPNGVSFEGNHSE